MVNTVQQWSYSLLVVYVCCWRLSWWCGRWQHSWLIYHLAQHRSTGWPHFLNFRVLMRVQRNVGLVCDALFMYVFPYFEWIFRKLTHTQSLLLLFCTQVFRSHHHVPLSHSPFHILHCVDSLSIATGENNDSVCVCVCGCVPPFKPWEWQPPQLKLNKGDYNNNNWFLKMAKKNTNQLEQKKNEEIFVSLKMLQSREKYFRCLL